VEDRERRGDGDPLGDLTAGCDFWPKPAGEDKSRGPGGRKSPAGSRGGAPVGVWGRSSPEAERL